MVPRSTLFRRFRIPHPIHVIIIYPIISSFACLFGVVETILQNTWFILQNTWFILQNTWFILQNTWFILQNTWFGHIINHITPSVTTYIGLYKVRIKFSYKISERLVSMITLTDWLIFMLGLMKIASDKLYVNMHV